MATLQDFEALLQGTGEQVSSGRKTPQELGIKQESPQIELGTSAPIKQGGIMTDTQEQQQYQQKIQEKISKIKPVSEQVGERLQQGAVDIGRIQSEVQRGKIGLKEAVPEGIGSLVKTGAESVIAPLTNTVFDVIEEPLSIGIQKFNTSITEASKKRAQEMADEGKITQEEVDSTAQTINESFKGGLVAPFTEIKQQFDQSDPKTQSMIRTALNFGSVALDVFGGFEGKKITGEVVEQISKKVPKATEEVREGFVSSINKAKELTKEKEALLRMGETETPRTTLQKQADQSAGNLNRILPKKAEDFKKKTGGVEHGEWLNKRGINSTIDKNIDTLSEKFLNEKKILDEAVSEIPGKHNPPVFKKILDEATDLAKEEERSGDLNLLEGIARKLDFEKGVSAEDILKIKRLYERTNKFAYSKALDSVSASKLVKATQRDTKLRESLIDIAENAGFAELRTLSKEVQQTRFLLDQIGVAQARAASKPIFNISDRILGGASIADPKLALGMVVSKTLGAERAKSLFQKTFAGKPQKTITVNLPKIKQKAKEMIKAEKKVQKAKRKELTKQHKEDVKKAEKEFKAYEKKRDDNISLTKEQWGVTRELEDIGKLTRQEQAMIEVAKDSAELAEVKAFLLEAKGKGQTVGEGFVMSEGKKTISRKERAGNFIKSIDDQIKKGEFDIDEAKKLSTTLKNAGRETMAKKIDNYVKEMEGGKPLSLTDIVSTTELENKVKDLSGKIGKVKSIKGLDLPSAIKTLEKRKNPPKVLEELKLLDDNWDEFIEANPQYKDMTVDEFYTQATEYVKPKKAPTKQSKKEVKPKEESSEEFVEKKIQLEKDKLIKPLQEKINKLEAENTRDIGVKQGDSKLKQINNIDRKIRFIQNEQKDIGDYIVDSDQFKKKRVQLKELWDKQTKQPPTAPKKKKATTDKVEKKTGGKTLDNFVDGHFARIENVDREKIASSYFNDNYSDGLDEALVKGRSKERTLTSALQGEYLPDLVTPDTSITNLDEALREAELRRANGGVIPKKTKSQLKSIWEKENKAKKATKQEVKTPKTPKKGVDLFGNEIEQIFVKKGTKLEQAGGTARQRGMNKVPEKSGYEVVYKPYGEQGKGYYYVTTPKAGSYYRETSAKRFLEDISGKGKYEPRYFSDNLDTAIGQVGDENMIIKMSKKQDFVEKVKGVKGDLGGEVKITNPNYKEGIESILIKRDTFFDRGIEGQRLRMNLRNEGFDVPKKFKKSDFSSEVVRGNKYVEIGNSKTSKEPKYKIDENMLKKSSKVKSLAEKAKKFDTAEEFVEAGQDDFLIQRYIRAIDFNNRRFSSKDFGGYKEITIWRTADSPIDIGDYVYATREEAEEALKAGQGKKLFSKRIGSDEIVQAGAPAGEFFYSPKRFKKYSDARELWYESNNKKNPFIAIREKEKIRAKLESKQVSSGAGEWLDNTIKDINTYMKEATDEQKINEIWEDSIAKDLFKTKSQLKKIWQESQPKYKRQNASNVIFGDPISNKEANKIIREYFTPEEVSVTFANKILMPDGRRALGQQLDNAITMVKNPEGYTPDHESFHVFSNLFAERKAVRSLLKETKAKYKLADDLDAEEWLANAFSQYAVGLRKASWTKQTREFFKTLWNDMKSFFGKEDKARKMYDDLIGKKRPRQRKGSGEARFKGDDKLTREVRKFASAEEYVKSKTKFFSGEIDTSKKFKDIKGQYVFYKSKKPKYIFGESFSGKDDWYSDSIGRQVPKGSYIEAFIDKNVKLGDAEVTFMQRGAENFGGSEVSKKMGGLQTLFINSKTKTVTPELIYSKIKGKGYAGEILNAVGDYFSRNNYNVVISEKRFTNKLMNNVMEKTSYVKEGDNWTYKTASQLKAIWKKANAKRQ